MNATIEPNPAAGAAPAAIANTVKACVGAIDRGLGPLDDKNKHVLAVRLTALLSKWVQGVVEDSLNGKA